VVLTGAGERAFCAGADLKERQAMAPAEIRTFLERLNHVLRLIEESRTVFIAALNGPAAGLGFVIALYADIRFAASEAKLTTSFAQRGLIAEHGSSWLLPRLVGPAHALDLLLSARKIGAAEAERLGLVNKVFAQAGFMDEVMAYARALADTVSPRSMAVIKAQLWKVPFQDFAGALALADEEMQKSFKSEDFREGRPREKGSDELVTPV